MSSDDGQVPLLERAEMSDTTPTIPKETAREIALLEREFVEAEVQAFRASIPRLRPLFNRRNALIANKLADADFWPRVFAFAPEIENYLLPSDEIIISECLKNFTVERIGVNEAGDAGDPRNVRFTFEFDTSPERNAWFGGDGKVVKEFYWRKSIGVSEKSGRRKVWEGLVSKPVRIPWREPEMDPTKGLLDAACNLAEAEEKAAAGEKITPEQRLELPEYEKLVTEVAKVDADVGLDAERAGDGDDEDDEDDIEHDSRADVSFFAWFGYRGRDISAEESEEAMKADEEYWAKIARGEKVESDEEKEGDAAAGDEFDEDEDDDDDEDGLMDAEIYPEGHDLAMSLCDEVWDNALKHFVVSLQPPAEFEGIDFDMDGMEDDDDDDDDEETDRPRKKVKT
ncbi:hypothetical protein GX51_05416 [Blastomyces parvus]|uniref:Uncharacterized protein n=1 Tax=Blastomyces parvus TaxID=2060905 RepID=A0A2B7WX79_9EURO|nr:hypothetical protein GX51_05416 [Blastomyces parvus]